MFECEDVRTRHERRHRTDIHPILHKQPPQFHQTWVLLHRVAHQIRAEPFVTTVFIAYAHEVYACVAEHGAYLVNGAVGICCQQDRRLVVGCELFLHHITHGRRGLARSGRPNEQEIVAGLHGPQQQVVEVVTIAFGKSHRHVAPWLTLRQHKLTTVGRRGHKVEQRTHGGSTAHIAA